MGQPRLKRERAGALGGAPFDQLPNLSVPSSTLSLVTPRGPDILTVGDDMFDAEVVVADTDALLRDACDMLLTGRPSPLLRAIRMGAAHVVMSDRAFRELGWMSAKCARFHGVADADLRAVLTREYLPRIPVVVVPPADCGMWTPDATEVRDPDDVEHVQVARLIAARMIYSHDRHLRGPRFAPANRPEYEARIGHLAAVASQKEAESGLGMLAVVTGSGTSKAVSRISTQMNVKPTVVWAALALTAAGSLYVLFAPPGRRRRIGEALAPLLEHVSAVLERGMQARHALSSTRLISPEGAGRLEAMVGAYLARNPDSTMSRIAGALDLDTDGRQQLSLVLRQHPSFELVSRHGWAIGRTRGQLETNPRSRPGQ